MNKVDRFIRVNAANCIILIAGLVLAPCSFSQSAVLDEARGAFAAQDWETVVEALGNAPASAEQSRLLGLAYYHLQQTEQALPLLRQAMQSDTSDTVVKQALVDVLLARQQLQSAKTVLARLPDNADEQSQWLRARIALAEDNVAEIDRLYRSLVAAEDTHIAQESAAQYIAYLQSNGRHAEAYTIAQQALARDPDSFLSYRFNQVTDISDQPQSNPWRFSLGYRLEYDDNVALLADSSAPAGDQDQEDFRHVLTADALYQQQLANNWMVFAEARASQSLHHEITEFDFTRLNALLGSGQTFENWGWRLPIEVTHNRFGGDSFNTTVAVSPGFFIRLTDNFYSHLYGHYASSDFDVVAFPEDDRSADVYGAGVLFGGRLGQRWTLRTIIEYLDYAADGSNWDRNEFQAFAYGEYSLTSAWSLGLGARFTSIDFANSNVPFQIERDDESFEYYFSTSYKLADGWFLRAQLTYVDNQSTIEVFDYERLVGSLGLSWQF